MTAACARLLGLGVLAALAAACGAKGKPLPPLRPIPNAVADWSIERDGAGIKLRIPIPDTNRDESQPPAVDHVEIYALSKKADEPAPGVAELIVPANLVGTIMVRPPESPKEKPKKPDATPDPRPAAGDVTTYVDTVQPATEPTVRYIATVAAAGRRKSHTSSILPVPLSEVPARPEDVKVDYTEQKLTLTWSGATGVRYIVEETNEQGASAKRLSESPQEASTYESPVEFGKLRCLAVRAADVKGAVTVISPPTAPACVTPRDRFPPPAPTGLTAVPGDPGVAELIWSSVQAADLAGYLILRGDGANGTLQPLTTDPVTSTSYNDKTATPGSMYVYAVVAVDKAVPPNKSEISNKATVTVR